MPVRHCVSLSARQLRRNPQEHRVRLVDQAAKAMRDEAMLAEIENFIEGFNQPTACGPMGSGWPRGRASTAGAATAGRMPSGLTR
jgi:hypothetical protein